MDILTSCLIYFICFSFPSFVTLLSKNFSKSIRIFILLIGITPVVIFTFIRYGVATDYFNYDKIFTYVKDYRFSEVINFNNYPREIGFKLIIKMFDGVSNSIIFGIFGLLTIIPVITILKEKYNKSIIALSLSIIYYLFMFYSISLNALRQCLACSFVLLGIVYLFKQKKWCFYIFLIVAVLFHYTASIAIIIPLFWDVKNNKNINLKRLSVLLGIMFLGLIFWQIIVKSIGLDTYLRYIDLKSSGNNYSFYIKLLFTSVCLLYRKKLVNYDYRNSLYINLSIITLFISAFGFVCPFIIRCSWYFEYTNIFIITSFPYVISKNNLIRLACFISIVIFCMTWFFGVECGLLSGNLSGFLPVRFLPNL